MFLVAVHPRRLERDIVEYFVCFTLVLDIFGPCSTPSPKLLVIERIGLAT